MVLISAEESQGRTLKTFMPSMGLLGESRNGITQGVSRWTRAVIPGKEQTFFIAAGNQVEAAAPCLGCQLEGTVPLRKPQHAGFACQERVLSTQDSSLQPQEREGV